MNELEQLGLSPYEAKVYTTLLEYGRITARDIALKSGVPPTAVYPNLKKLISKNLVQEFKGDISLFESLDPTIAIPALIQDQKRILEEAEHGATELAHNLFHRKQIVKEPEVLNISMGGEASGQIYVDSLRRAQKTYFVFGWTFKTSRSKLVKLHHLVEAQQRGVDVRIIVTAGSGKQWSILKEYIDKKIKLKYYPLENFSLLIVDGKECKITLKNREYPNKFNIHVHDVALAGALQSYFLDVWKKSDALSKQQLGTG